MGRVRRHMICSSKLVTLRWYDDLSREHNCLQWNQEKLQITSRETSQIQTRHLGMIEKLTWLFLIVCWIKTRPHTTFFPMYMFACPQHATVVLFLFEFTLTASSPLGHFGRFSRRSLQLYVRALSVSLITIANISDCNLYPSATAKLFSIRDGASFSMSTGYVNLQLRPSTKVLIMSPACQSLPRRIQSNFSHYSTWRPADGLPSSIPYDCPKLLCCRQWSCHNREHVFLCVPCSQDIRILARLRHILMEFVQGSKLSEIWRDLND